jgi:hypothetical protein
VKVCHKDDTGKMRCANAVLMENFWEAIILKKWNYNKTLLKVINFR